MARIDAARNNHQSSKDLLLGAKSLLASGIFQELKYPVIQSLPGATPGSVARFNVSSRIDPKLWKNSTSNIFINRIAPPPGTNWVGLRLDHGPNKQTGSTTNWHWNQRGALNSFDIPNHTVAKPWQSAFGRTMQYAKPLGRAAWVAGVAIDTFSLSSEISQSSQTGNWDNTVVEGSRIAGAWGGAFAGAKLVGTGGAALGTLICPGPGTAIGAAIGGLIGGAVGYFGGSKVGEWAGQEATD